jgi:hypothetical protein
MRPGSYAMLVLVAACFIRIFASASSGKNANDCAGNDVFIYTLWFC